METRPSSPKGEYFVQEYIVQGITHTRTVIYGRSVLNKERFVLAPTYFIDASTKRPLPVLILPFKTSLNDFIPDNQEFQVETTLV